MLQILTFTVSIILSVCWIIGGAIYIEARIGFNNLITMNPSDLAFFITAVFIPVIVLWIIVGFIYYSSIISKQGYFLNLMLIRMKRSSEENEIILKSIIESQGYFKNRETLRFVDMSIDDMNNTLAEIAVRMGIIRKVSTETLWHRVGEGDRWAFCNIILENADEIRNFDKELKHHISRNEILAKQITSFCTRFEETFALLETNPNNRPMLNILESSVLGEVYTKFSKALSPEFEEEEIKDYKVSIKDLRKEEVADEEEYKKGNKGEPIKKSQEREEEENEADNTSAFVNALFGQEAFFTTNFNEKEEDKEYNKDKKASHRNSDTDETNTERHIPPFFTEEESIEPPIFTIEIENSQTEEEYTSDKKEDDEDSYWEERKKELFDKYSQKHRKNT